MTYTCEYFPLFATEECAPLEHLEDALDHIFAGYALVFFEKTAGEPTPEVAPTNGVVLDVRRHRNRCEWLCVVRVPELQIRGERLEIRGIWSERVVFFRRQFNDLGERAIRLASRVVRSLFLLPKYPFRREAVRPRKRLAPAAGPCVAYRS